MTISLIVKSRSQQRLVVVTGNWRSAMLQVPSLPVPGVPVLSGSQCRCVFHADLTLSLLPFELMPLGVPWWEQDHRALHVLFAAEMLLHSSSGLESSNDRNRSVNADSSVNSIAAPKGVSFAPYPQLLKKNMTTSLTVTRA